MLIKTIKLYIDIHWSKTIGYKTMGNYVIFQVVKGKSTLIGTQYVSVVAKGPFHIDRSYKRNLKEHN